MYIYETHQHTARCSACGRMQPEEAIRQLLDNGFAGMVMTEHFYHGNTGVRRHQPWSDFVAAYERAWWEAKEIGERLNFDVLFGIEEDVGDGKDVLVYGITPQVLYEHPELQEDGSTRQRLARLSGIVHEAGGLLYQAHPFRVRGQTDRPWEPLPLEYLDGLEGYNASNDPFANARAVQYATQKGLDILAGSDSHSSDLSVRYGILCDQRIRTGEELVDVLLDGAYDLYLPGLK